MPKGWARQITKKGWMPTIHLERASSYHIKKDIRRKFVITDSLIKEAREVVKKNEVDSIIPPDCLFEADDFRRTSPYPETINVKKRAADHFLEGYEAKPGPMKRVFDNAKKLSKAGVDSYDALALSVAREKRRLK